MTDSPQIRDYVFTHLYNFRDVGGLAGLDGRTVRWRRLFRSDSLHGLCSDDRESFCALGIRTVLDLRRPYEVERDGRVPDWNGIVWQHIHPTHRAWELTPFQEGMELPRYLADRYLDMAEEGAAELAKAVELIADERAAPLVVHCVAGKDRTGVVCALTLSLLGVSDIDISADYALTGTAFGRVADPTVPAWYRSPAEAMLLFLTGLKARHGSVDKYLTGAGLSADRIDALRHHLLVG